MQTIREEMKGRDLPASLRKKAKVNPDEIVTVIIQPGRDELTRQLLAISNRASAEAKKHGLTEEKLFQLLHEKE